MKKNAGRLSKKIFAAMMAGTLMTAMVGMNVSAADGVYSQDNITISKTVTTDGNTYAPNTTFKFNVAVAGEGNYDGNVVYAGVSEGLVVNQNANFVPGEIVSETYTSTGSLGVNLSKFTYPGVYHYTVNEIPESYEGISYDPTVYDVYVYIMTEDDGDLYVENVVSKKQGAEDKEKSNLSFTNDYGANNDSTHDVTITKDVTGNQGDRNKDFTFNVTVTGTTGEKYKVVVNDGSTPQFITSGANNEFTLSDGDTIHIYGLSASDEVKVDETDYSTDGYTTTYTSSKGTMKVTNDGTKADYIQGTITEDGATITVQNDKQANTPTGIAMTYGPYALMVVLAGGMAVLFFRRRNREDY